MASGLQKVVLYDAPPIHVAMAGLSLLLPVSIALWCLCMRKPTPERTATTARRAYIALHIQFAYFVFSTTSNYLDNWLRYRVTLDTTGAAYRAMSYLTMGHLLWGIALQVFFSLAAAVIVTLRLRQQPRLWDLRFTLAGFGLVLGAEILVSLLFMS